MSKAIRLDDALIRDAEAEAMSTMRSLPKQVEYWAKIGKAVAKKSSSVHLNALICGLAEIDIKEAKSPAVPANIVFDALENDRVSGSLSIKVTQANVWYEASQNEPGLLDCVYPDGARQTGHFKGGVFIPNS